MVNNFVAVLISLGVIFQQVSQSCAMISIARIKAKSLNHYVQSNADANSSQHPALRRSLYNSPSKQFHTAIGGSKAVLRGGSSVGQQVVSGTKYLTCEDIFTHIKDRVARDPSVNSQVNAVFVFQILKNGIIGDTWTLDFRKGEMYNGKPHKGVNFDSKFTLEESVMLDIANQKLRTKTALTKNKIKIEGSKLQSLKLQTLKQLMHQQE